MDGATASTIASIVNAEMLQGVLNEILALLPVVLPVSITFIGIRKGLSFLTGALHSA